MKNLSHAALWCGLASVLSAAQSPDAAIAGLVVEDHSGAPVRSALVRLFPLEGRGTLKEADTDIDGRFEFAALPAGAYRVEVGKANYVLTIVTLDAWQATADAGVPALHLVRHGVIAGRTVPSGSAQIVAVESVPADVEPRRFSAARSEASAEFRLFDLPPGTYVLAAVNGSTDAGLRRGVIVYPGGGQARTFAIAGGEEYLDIEMPIPGDAFSVRGRMIAPDEGARHSVALSLRAIDHPWALVWGRLLQSNEEILIESLVPGRYELTATVGFGQAQRLSGQVRFDLDRPGLEGLELPLEPVHAPKAKAGTAPAQEPVVIRGTVSGVTTPVFVALIDRTPGRSSPIRAALVRPGGDFMFGRLEPGRYHVTAQAAATRDARWIATAGGEADLIDLAAGESKSIDLRLAGGRQ